MSLFRPLAPRTARWRPAGGEGLEHLDLSPAPDGGVLARACVIGSSGGVPFGARYRILCDADWRVRAFCVEATDGRRLDLVSPEPGLWRGGADGGEPRPDLEGCVDVDLSASPFTNTLPVRRLGLTRAAGPADLRMVYVPFDTLAPYPDGQRYAAIEDGRLYRYEAADGTFSAEIPLDADGLVLDYPGLFRRLF